MTDQYLGEIRMFAGTFAPKQWAICEGGILPVSNNEALFSLYGTVYGGDGRVNFALPDLRGRIPIHQGQGPGLHPYNIGARGGLETERLQANNIPSHNHPLQASSDAGTSDEPQGLVFAKAAGNFYDDKSSTTPLQQLIDTSIADTGEGQPHNNMMPYLGMNFIVALVGLFPSRN